MLRTVRLGWLCWCVGAKKEMGKQRWGWVGEWVDDRQAAARRAHSEEEEEGRVWGRAPRQGTFLAVCRRPAGKAGCWALRSFITPPLLLAPSSSIYLGGVAPVLPPRCRAHAVVGAWSRWWPLSPMRLWMGGVGWVGG